MVAIQRQLARSAPRLWLRTMLIRWQFKVLIRWQLMVSYLGSSTVAFVTRECAHLETCSLAAAVVASIGRHTCWSSYLGVCSFTVAVFTFA